MANKIGSTQGTYSVCKELLKNTITTDKSHTNSRRFCGPWVMAKYTFLILLLTVSSISLAQSPVTISSGDMNLRIGGTFQSRATFLSNPNLNPAFDETQYGFGVRRARIRLYGTISPKLRLFLQMEGSGATATFTDLRAEWDMTDRTMLRAGRFVGAQPASMAFTLHHEIDGLDRAAIAENWARQTLGADARSFGVEVVHRLDELELRAFAHSGSNTRNIRGGVSDGANNFGQNPAAFAVSGMIRYLPKSIANSEAGVYFGHNPTKTGDPRTYSDGSAHLYWGSKVGLQPTRVKLDMISVRFTNQTTYGASVFVGQLIGEDVEVFGRAELYDSDLDIGSTSYLTLGATKKLLDWANRLTVAASLKQVDNPAVDPVFLMTAQWQVYF
jgi:hypothetical protein